MDLEKDLKFKTIKIFKEFAEFGVKFSECMNIAVQLQKNELYKAAHNLEFNEKPQNDELIDNLFDDDLTKKE